LSASGAVRIVLNKLDGSTVDYTKAQDTITAWIETKDLHLGSTEFLKALAFIVFEITGKANLDSLEVTLKYRDQLSETLQSEAAVPINESDPLQIRPPDARYVRIRLSDSAISQIWKLTAMEFHGEVTSKRQ
jgi:hypothetical protein